MFGIFIVRNRRIRHQLDKEVVDELTRYSNAMDEICHTKLHSDVIRPHVKRAYELLEEHRKDYSDTPEYRSLSKNADEVKLIYKMGTKELV